MQEIPIETVRTAAFSMQFFRFGRGEIPLVILPGLSVQSVMDSAAAIAQAYRKMANAFTVYVFDRRSDLPAAYTVNAMAEDTAAALQALSLRKVCLFGASQGGMLALLLAIRHPALVGKLVLGSTTARLTPERFRVIESWIRLAAAGDAEGLYLAFGRAIFPPPAFELIRTQLCAAAETVTPAELQRFAILAAAMRDFDVTPALGQIDCPVLVLAAADDQVLGPDAADAIVSALGGRPDFAMHLYDGFGHAAYDTAPDYKARMLQFLLQPPQTN